MEKIVYGSVVADKVKSDVRNYIGQLKEELGFDDLTGKKAAVFGRSNIVGKPIAKLLLDKNCDDMPFKDKEYYRGSKAGRYYRIRHGAGETCQKGVDQRKRGCY